MTDPRSIIYALQIAASAKMRYLLGDISEIDAIVTQAELAGLLDAIQRYQALASQAK